VTPFDEIEEAAAFVAGRSPLRPAFGVVLGSGLGAFADAVVDAVRIPFGEIPHFPVAGALGHRGELVLGTLEGIPVAVQAGRVHFYEGWDLEEVVFPVRVLSRIGVRSLVLTNAAGGINTSFSPGDLMVIEDHINLMGTNPLIGHNEDRLGPRFPDMSEAWDRGMANAAERCCMEAGAVVRRGIYLGLSGPSYETPAEIRMARILGADAVGMSTVPEAIAARHAGLRVVGISCITNHAAGVTSAPLDHAEVLAVGARLRTVLCDALTRLVRVLSTANAGQA
jgi:purine-nucleoside phosphorylase